MQVASYDPLPVFNLLVLWELHPIFITITGSSLYINLQQLAMASHLITVIIIAIMFPRLWPACYHGKFPMAVQDGWLTGLGKPWTHGDRWRPAVRHLHSLNIGVVLFINTFYYESITKIA